MNVFLNVFLILISALIFPAPLHAIQKPKEFLVVDNFNATTGMFAAFGIVAGFLDLYDRGQCAGMRVDFGTKGLYYDPARGPNWWQYYCAPIHLGNARQATVRKTSIPVKNKRADYITFEKSRDYMHQLIKKYIRIKPHIENKVQRLYDKYMSRCFVIGVHYRGTDKIIEAPSVPYAQAIQEVKKCIAAKGLTIYRLYVATDEKRFLEAIKKAFPGRVISQMAMRAEEHEPIHKGSPKPYQQGEEAIVDALLLSKTHLLIRTSSNLSLWSSYFNPQLPVVLLNQRYIGGKQ